MKQLSENSFTSESKSGGKSNSRLGLKFNYIVFTLSIPGKSGRKCVHSKNTRYDLEGSPLRAAV